MRTLYPLPDGRQLRALAHRDGRPVSFALEGADGAHLAYLVPEAVTLHGASVATVDRYGGRNYRRCEVAA